MKKYILVGQTPVPCNNVIEWALWFEHSERHVRLTRVGPLVVSTVFLGIDHQWWSGPPILYETMIYAHDPTDVSEERCSFLDFQTRCSTWEQAERQHDAAVAMIREHPEEEIEQLYPEPLPAIVGK